MSRGDPNRACLPAHACRLTLPHAGRHRLTAAHRPRLSRFKLPKITLEETLVGVFVIMILGLIMGSNV